MSNLFIEAVEAVKHADGETKRVDVASVELANAKESEASAVEVACATAHAWFLSTNKKHGGKKQLSDAAQVSEKTIGRYIAGGHVAMVTSGKVTASEVNSAIGNYSMRIAEVEKVNSVSDWQKLLKACKAVKKSGAGKVTGKASTPAEAEATEAKPSKKSGSSWENLAVELVGEIAQGNVSLGKVMDYLTELVSMLGMEATQEVEV